MKRLALLLSLFVFSLPIFAQREHPSKPTVTGAPMIFEQSCYDVQAYDLSIKVDIANQSISGTTVMKARVVIPTNAIMLDLDTPYTVSKVGPDANGSYKFKRTEDKIWIYFPSTKQPGEEFTTVISYSGKPRVAPNPPWVGGFMWKKTPSGADWVSIAMQNDGPDMLFPSKDHPSDKASDVAMHVTVPDPLIAAGPGKYVGVKKNSDATSTYSWHMTNPIPNYEILFNAAPYKVIKDSTKSIAGETIPIEFYVLPEDYDKGAWLVEETKKYTAFYEKYLGPFPWRSQKLGIVETPHLGMEHATAIAYGNQFKKTEFGFDSLMLHEFGHEWWANLVTASDWRDFWIHEGFQSFMDTLYLEHLGKKEAYIAAMKNRASHTLNIQAVAPREASPAYQVYFLAPDYIKSNGDVYGKGAVVLNTLRYLIGDDAFFRSIRRMAYPKKEMEKWTDGRQTRLVNTDDFLAIAEDESKMDLDWFFELYLRQPKLAKLVTETSGNTLNLRWETPNNLPFPMPIDVEVNGKIQRVEMKDGKGSVSYTGATPVIDPNGWVLKAQ